MSLKRKIALSFGATIVVLVAAAGGVRAYMVWKQGQDELPTFIDVPEGPRAPNHAFLGLEVGKSTVEEAEVLYRGLGVECGQSSFRALMESKRKQTIKAMEAAKAAGGDPDAVSGASLVNYRSKKERNPQVRLACEHVPLASFKDRERASGDDLYWLIIFDSPKHPLRHTSISRRLKDTAFAEEEWRDAVEAMTRKFGAPTTLRAPGDKPGIPFGPGTVYTASWKFADLEAEVKALRIGDDIRFSETVEVPWPVRTQ
jgi:hypothetical protein